VIINLMKSNLRKIINQWPYEVDGLL
jgi:hypothetical protein